MRKGALPAAARNRSGRCHVHHAEPADVALAKARELAAGESDDDFCDECGRRLARACIHWSDWVVRRVEKVRFRDDRSVNRQISIDFLVREDAPVYQAPGGRRFWLVPVSVMRRKTLVNYSLRDEEGSSIHFPGLRLTQNLDESVLRAVASRELGDSLSKEAEAFIRDVITGELEQVQERMNSLADGRAPAEILRLSSEKKIFNILLHRLSFCYTLYAFIEADEGRRHRILHMSIDEPLTFYYREPELAADPEGGYADELSHPRDDIVPWWHKARLAAALGWVPTKVRFRVPAAENAASFHFEIEAPTGVDIVEASLVAGIPGGSGSGSGPSFDHIRLRLPTFGLHVVDVPNGSSSMAQVDLQVVTRGWHTTLLLSCWATFLLLVAVLLHVHTREITTPADVIVVLAGVAAAVATLIAQGEFSGMAGRLVGLLRAFAAVEASLPLIAASLFLFGGHSVSRRQWELLFLCVVAALITAIITISWTKARLRLRTKHHVTSPWEIAPGLKKPADGPRDFDEARQQYGYQMPAIRVDTAEAWHHHFRWTKDIEAHAEALLSKKGQS